MTTLVMGLAGAVIGGFIGGPTGARIGWAIGTYLGQRMSEPDINNVGPRLDDLQVTSSIYGAAIPIAYGTIRMSGNMIWSSDIREEKHVEDVGGGKGSLDGGSQTQTTYTYFASFAIGFSEGEGKQLLRIWADGKLIWSMDYGFAAPDAEDGTLGGKALSLASIAAQAKGTIRFYPGNEVQLPDPLIMSHEGTDIPAHRGLCYVVFDDLALKDYGNRIPNITAEISYITPPEDAIAEWYDKELLYTPYHDYDDDFYTPNARTRHVYNKTEDAYFTTIVFTLPEGGSEIRILKFAADDLTLLGWRDIRDLVSDDITDAGLLSGAATALEIGIDASDRLYMYLPVGNTLRRWHNWNGYFGDQRSHLIVWDLDAATLVPVHKFTLPFTSGVSEYSQATFATIQGFYVCNYDFYQTAGLGAPYGQGGVMVSWLGSVSNPVPNMYYQTGGIYEDMLISGEAHNGYLIGFRTVQDDTGLVDTNGDNIYENFSIVIYTHDTRVSSASANYSARIDMTPYISADTRWLRSNPSAFTDVHGVVSRYLEYDNSLLVVLEGYLEDNLIKQHFGVIKLNLPDIAFSGSVWTASVEWHVPHADNLPGAFLEGTNYMPIESNEYPATAFYAVANVLKVRKLDFDTGTIADDIWDFAGEFLEGAAVTPDISWYTPEKPNRIYGMFDGSYTLGDMPIDTFPMIFTTHIAQKDNLTEIVDTLTLADVVRDICSRVDLDPATDLEVSELEPYIVPGYVIPRQMLARAPIQQLSMLYLFDLVESDYKLVGKMRGRVAVATLSEDDFITMDADTGDIIRETRIQEVELPVEFAITYKDRNADYNPNTQRAMRSQQPIPTMESVNKASEDIPISQTATFIKQAVEKILYAEWLNRITYEGTTSWRWLKLDPSDVILITFDDGTIYETRIIQNEFQGEMAIPLAMLSEDAALFTSDAEGYSGDGYRPWELITYGPTKLFLLNVPLLRDIHSVQREYHQVYYAAAGKSGNWPGTNILTTSDGLNYAVAGQMPNESPWGVTQNGLPQTDTPFITDYDTQLVVFMQRGGDTLESVSRSQILTDSANAAAVITADGDIEVIQYEFAIENPDGSYTLSGLYRGRRGTDYLVNDHGVGEYIIMLSGTTVDRLQFALDQRGISKEYRAVTYGTLLDDATPIDFAPTGVELMPYAPVHQEAAENAGDIDITWVRRTRINGGWKDGTGDIPLNEDTEEYVLEIYDGPGGTLLRTYTGITSPSYTYPSADITTDFGSVPSNLTIKVYQVSAQVGRGFSNEVTIPVE